MIKHFVKFIIFLLLAVIVAIIGLALFFHSEFSKTNYVGDETYEILSELPEETYIDENGTVRVLTESTLMGDSENDVIDQINSAAGKHSNHKSNEEAGITNILLIGVDRRDESWYGNSDTMILLTINKTTGTLRLTSFMRDSAANIPEIGVRKLNAACAYGGPLLLVDTLESNYAIDIDYYAMVDFQNMINIVDAIGGVDLEITDSEVEVGNSYIGALCAQYGTDPTPHYFNSSGLIHMDGYQAVAYARNRTSGGTYDYGRTERQRKLLEAIFTSFKNVPANELLSTFNSILPYITHNMSEMEVLSFSAELASLTSYSTVQSRVPYDGLYHYDGEIIVPDWDATLDQLHGEIYP